MNCRTILRLIWGARPGINNLFGKCKKYDIILTMNKKIVILSVLCVALGACSGAREPSPMPVQQYAVDEEYTPMVDASTSVLKYSMPAGNDLVLETPRHIIHIDAQPGVSYGYYVWTGDKKYSDDPDLVVEDGTAYILVED